MSKESDKWYEERGYDTLLDEYGDTMREAFEAGEHSRQARILKIIARSRDRNPTMQKLYQDIEELE